MCTKKGLGWHTGTIYRLRSKTPSKEGGMTNAHLGGPPLSHPAAVYGRPRPQCCRQHSYPETPSPAKRESHRVRAQECLVEPERCLCLDLRCLDLRWQCEWLAVNQCAHLSKLVGVAEEVREGVLDVRQQREDLGVAPCVAHQGEEPHTSRASHLRC